MKSLRVVVIIMMVAVVACFALTACVDPEPTEIDYGIKALKDLTDYGNQNESQYFRPTPYVYNKDAKTYQNSAAQIQVDQLQNQINKEKTDFDNQDAEQSTFQKILAFSTPDEVLESLAYAALPVTQMQGLVEYLAAEGSDNFFDQYAEMEKQDQIMKDNPNSETDAYRNAYKTQQRLRRGIFTRLNKRIGMSGDQAARCIVQASWYAEEVVKNAMIPAIPVGQLNGSSTTMDEYFKALESKGGLFDYDTLVFLKTNQSFRGTLNADRQSANDAAIVRAYGYSYDYQSASYDALSEADFEKELNYHFMEYFESNNDALDYARIKRINYAKGYRYTDTFYKNYYASLNLLEIKQEEIENEVYGINKAETIQISVQGVVGRTETQIDIKIGKTTNVTSGVKLKGQALNIGIKADLNVGDIEYYYNGIDENVAVMATKQRAFEKKRMTGSKPGTAGLAAEQFDLEIQNLKMTEFTISEFIAKNYKQGLTESLKGQIFGAAADQSIALNQMKKDLIIKIAELGGIPDQTSTEYSDKVYEIGRLNARMSQYVTVVTGSMTTINAKIEAADKVAWDKVHTEMKDAMNHDYSSIAVSTNDGKTPRLNQLHYLLMKRDSVKPDGTKIPYIPGVNNVDKDYPIEYDTNHNISRILYNQEDVLYHTAGLIRARFFKAEQIKDELIDNDSDVQNRYGIIIAYSTDKKSAYKTVEVNKGEKFENGDNVLYPLPDKNDAPIRGTVPSNYVFKGWFIDRAGYYMIDYNETVEYTDCSFYAVFG